MMTILLTEELSIGYAQRVIAQNISLSISTGLVVGLLGANGIGKSTFFKTLLNIIPPLSGKIAVQGQNIAELSPAQRTSLVGYVPQIQKNIPDFKVNDFVLMGRASHIGLFSQPGKPDQEIADFYLSLMHISHLHNRYFHQLSGGEQQLVLIVRSLVQQPKLLLMDEPTASLDFGNQVLVLESILNLQERGYSVIFSTHQPTQIPPVANQLLVMSAHTIQLLNNPRQFINATNMADLYGLNASQIQKYMKI